MNVTRTDEGVVKQATDAQQEEGLRREYRILQVMAGSGVSPRPARLTPVPDGTDIYVETVQEDLGQSYLPGFGEDFRHNLIRLLAAIRRRHVRHGDCTMANLIVAPHGGVWAIDWQESHLSDEEPPQKQPWSDSWLLMRNLQGTVCGDGLQDSPRIARRWMAILHDLGADYAKPWLPAQGRAFTDFGCFEGDFVAMAATEGMNAIGIDAGGFRTGYNSIVEGAIGYWGEGAFGTGNLTWRLDDIVKVVREDPREWSGPGQISMCFSTWPYIANEHGREVADEVLRRIIANSERLYFETQLYGDGPGVPWHPTDDSVGEDLIRLGGNPEPITRIHVTGRPAFRTVWRVTPR